MFVMTHKAFKFELPQNYKKLLVGAFNKKVSNDYLCDDRGENISSKNLNYCELTGLYWLWKNRTDDYVGLSHYRRYFRQPLTGMAKLFPKLYKKDWQPIASDELIKEMSMVDWIVAEPLDFGKLNVYQQYEQAHFLGDLVTTRNIIQQLFPEFIPAFDRVMEKNELSPFNMFYTKKSNMDSYCEWLFSILFELEKKIDFSNHEGYQVRVYGFLSERLLNVWLEFNNSRFKIKKLPVFNLDEDFN